MQKTFKAVYEKSVLRPLVPLSLANAQHVQVSIADMNNDIAAYFDDVTLQDVRLALSSIQGSLSEAVIASREERY
jgi:predicted DNA-binding antitoxin AbrB/MazE fold protein